MVARLDLATRLRLVSGLVLMAFVLGHLLNHGLGIFGLEAMEAGRRWFLALWRSRPGTLLLVLAALVHLGLALARVFQRRSLRMPIWEAAQILLGVAVPLLLILHVIGTRIAHEHFGTDDSYLLTLLAISQGYVLRQVALLLIVWLHGCIGIHYWLRIRPWYRRVQPWLLGAAVLVPALALAGFATGLREAGAFAAQHPEALVARAQAERWPDPQEIAWLYDVERFAVRGYLLLLVGVLAARGVREAARRRRGRVRLTYPGGRVVSVAPGLSVLEASRAHGIPHASVCGGRGRCSTCRVRVGEGGERLPAPSAEEARVLARLGAPPDVRLACQIRPVADLAVTPLLPATATPRDARAQLAPGQGVERELAVLFADLRAFTRMAEGRLPYDVVFVLNQYFRAMGTAIEAAGGRVDKFIGDGIMALFGIDQPPEIACRQALAATRAMALALDDLNRHLAHDLREPLRMAMGLHSGPVIVGEIGIRGASSLTAIGDTVNVASRLEALAKEQDAELVLSARVAERAGVVLLGLARLELELRGRRRPLAVHVAARATALPELPAPGAAPRQRWLWLALRAARRGRG